MGASVRPGALAGYDTLDGATAVVTGAAGGLGRAVAEQLAGLGCRVGIVDVDAAGLAETARSLGDGHWSATMDVADHAALRGFIDHVTETSGRLDVLVNNAATIVAGSVEDVTQAQFDRVFAVNVRAPLFAIQAAIPHFRRRGKGAIVNIASISSLVALPAQTVYCASKGAVAQLTRQVALDFAREGIRCNAVCPGTIDTPLIDRFLAQAPDPDGVVEALLAGHPIGRFATSDEIAAVVVFLASDLASFVTGALVSADGGYVAR